MKRIKRRNFLTIGTLTGGLTLAGYLRLEAAGKRATEKRSAILVFMEGAPSHLDTFDLKPNAATEIRGEFRPVATKQAGLQICEHLPLLAECTDQYALLPGITHNVADHGLAKKYLLTGNKASRTLSHPEYGSVVSHEFPSDNDLPGYVSIDESFVGPGYLGSRYSPLTAAKPKYGGRTPCVGSRWKTV